MVAGSNLPQAAVTLSQVQTEGSGGGYQYSTVEFKVSSPGIVAPGIYLNYLWQINFPSTSALHYSVGGVCVRERERERVR
jgi:hypothetical protein